MLRLFWFSVVRAREPEFEMFLRTEGVRAVRALPGVIRAFVGRSIDEPERWFEVSRWSSVEASMGGTALEAAIARLEAEPFAELSDRILLSYEPMDVEPQVNAAGAARILRVFHGIVPKDHSTAYYEWLREKAWPDILSRPGLVTALHGRRIVPGGHAFAFLSAWESMDDVRAAVADPARPIAFSPLVEDARIEHYALAEPELDAQAEAEPEAEAP